MSRLCSWVCHCICWRFRTEEKYPQPRTALPCISRWVFLSADPVNSADVSWAVPPAFSDILWCLIFVQRPKLCPKIAATQTQIPVASAPGFDCKLLRWESDYAITPWCCDMILLDYRKELRSDCCCWWCCCFANWNQNIIKALKMVPGDDDRFPKSDVNLSCNSILVFRIHFEILQREFFEEKEKIYWYSTARLSFCNLGWYFISDKGNKKKSLTFLRKRCFSLPATRSQIKLLKTTRLYKFKCFSSFCL